jgi:hypothetical protein
MITRVSSLWEAGVGILDRVELGVYVGDVTKEDGLVYFFNAK